MMLDKDKILFERDEKGELVAQEVEVVIDEDDPEQLEFKGETIMVTPMPRGKVKKIFAELLRARNDDEETRDIDSEIISEHCFSPRVTLEEAKLIKPPISGIIVDTIFEVSGVKNKKKTRKENIDDAEDEFAKN